MRSQLDRSCLQFSADEAGGGDVGGHVEYLDVPLEAQLEEGLAQLEVAREVVRQLVSLQCKKSVDHSGLWIHPRLIEKEGCANGLKK